MKTKNPSGDGLRKCLITQRIMVGRERLELSTNGLKVLPMVLLYTREHPHTSNNKGFRGVYECPKV